MDPKQKANQLISEYKILLMDENTECGNEILCTFIAQKSALVTVDKILLLCNDIPLTDNFLNIKNYWNQVKIEIENY